MNDNMSDDTDVYGENEPRTPTEIGDALSYLFDQVWYGRHHSLPTDGVPAEILAAACAAAEHIEDEIGVENLGPWTDFEWGMINGKLSALRWVLGEDWDMLDT